MNLDDRPLEDEEYIPIRSSEIVLTAWCPSDDALEEIIKIGRRVCDERAD